MMDPEYQTLTETVEVTAMIDISDGLATDITNLCRESGCGAVIDSDAVPLGPDYLKFCERHGIDALAFALSSGEEFELLFTVRGDAPPRIQASGLTANRIGSIAPSDNGIKLRSGDGSMVELTPTGYEHFKR